MTVSTTTSRVRYEGDGATSVFPIPFKFVDNAHVKVTLRDAADRETPWSEGSEYALSGAGVDSGGTLTVLTEPLDNRPRVGETLVIALDLPFVQDKAFPLGGAFPTTQVEEGLDLAALRDAQLAAFDSRAFSVPATDAQVGGLELPIDSLRAGRYLGFDAAGKPALLAGTAEAADVSDKTVLPTGSAQARSLADLFGLGALTAENVKLHGAKGDLVELADGSVTDGSAVLTSASESFTEADVGKVVWVEAASTTGKAITGIAPGPIDAVWQFDDSAGTFVDLTDDLNDAGGADVAPFPAGGAVDDVFYLGHIQTFDKVTFEIATSGVGGAVAWEYWDGAAWQALTVTDGTGGFTAAAGSHDLTFTPPLDWATTQLNSAINGRRLYYIRARMTTLYTTDPVLDRAVLDGGRIRITSTLHLVEPLQTISIKGVAGTTEANGTWQVERIGLDALDLIGPSFQNAYVSGGTIHGRLETTIQSVSTGDANLAANAGASISGTAVFGYGTDDTAAIQAAIDTKEALIFPQGDYLTDRITVSTERQRLIGSGGRLVAKPGATGVDGLITVEADFVVISGLYLDNPTEQKDDTGSSTTLRSGIAIKANYSLVERNVIRRFLNGIEIRFTDSSGPEYHSNVIHGNIVWDNLGAGSGDDQSGQGEDRGDGIVSWGAATVITSNIVHVKPGQDARIGIHVEALATLHDPVDHGARFPDRGAVISGNIILGGNLEERNGRWRRGIVTENVEDAQIVGNSVYGCTWWSIQASSAAPRNNVVIADNNILWTRPAVDLSGGSFSPDRAGIAIFGGAASGNLISNVAVANNNIEILGEVSQGILVSSFNSGADQDHIRVIGNGVRNNGGDLNAHIRAKVSAGPLIISNNSISGKSNTAAIQGANSRTHVIISDNTVDLPVGEGGEVIKMSGSGSARASIIGNILTGGNGDAIEILSYGGGVVVTGNVIDQIAGDGINAFGADPIIFSNNTLQNITGSYTVNLTPSSTKLDVNNVKN